MPSWRIDFNKQWLPGIAAAPHGLQWPSHKSQPGWLEASSLPTSRSRWSRGVPAHLLLEEEQLKKLPFWGHVLSTTVLALAGVLAAPPHIW